MSDKYFGSSKGLTIKSAAGTAFVSSDFNTGWMHGDCKLAALCDTETGSISAPELVTNGTFDTDTDWTKGTGVTISGNKANAVNTSGTLIEQPESFDDVKVCSFSFTVSNYAGGSVTAKWGTSKDVSPAITGDGSYTYYAEHGAADSDSIRFFASNFTGAISNVSVKEVTPDRSGNNNHLSIIGTLDRQPIGNGEIAAWSGFDGSNYLTATVPTGGDVYGWEEKSGVWTFCKTFSDFTSISESAGTLTIDGGDKLMLIRYGLTTPSLDQFEKIEHEERAMIEGKATLYSNSDDVTALAHDPVTGLLHVGTSDGRSVFDGLTRVDETTDPVTAAISAVDGIVAEH